MKDIRVISAKIVLKVGTIAPIRGVLPACVLAVGEKLDKTTEVFYNDLPVDEFFAQSPTRLIVKIPATAVGKPFVSLRVLSDASVVRRDSEVSLKLNNPLRTVSGMDRLIQNWIMTFMTTPGSDVFDKSSGGGALAIIGRTTDRDGRSASADLTMAIDRTRTELIKKQTYSNRVPSSEKLLSCELGDVVFDPYSGKLQARVFLRNMVGDSAEVSLGK